MSAEVSTDVNAAYHSARRLVQDEVNLLLEHVSLPDVRPGWDVIAIILDFDDPKYGEVIRESPDGKSYEFRLKIDHDEFLSADEDRHIKLVLKMLSRSIQEMGKLGASNASQRVLQMLLLEAEKSLLT